MAETANSANETDSGLQLLRRFAAGALVAGAAYFGWPAILGAALVTTALYSYQQYRTKKNYHRNLLELYRRDLAPLYDKSPESVTLDDLYRAAEPVENGGLGIVTFKKQLDSDNHDRNLRIMSEALSSLFIAAALITLNVTGIFQFPAGQLGVMHISFGALVGGAFALSHKFIDAAMDKWFGEKETDPRPINVSIANIARQIPMQPVQGVEIFSILVAANPELQRAIKAQNGAEFDTLPLQLRQQVMQSYDSLYRTESLTRAINAGEIKPSFLGFLAYGQVGEKLPDYRKYRELFSSAQNAMVEPAEGRTKYVERILSEEKTPVSGHAVH